MGTHPIYSNLNKKRDVSQKKGCVSNLIATMSYYETIAQYKNFDFNKAFNAVSADRARMAVNSESLDTDRFLSLLSPAAESYLEEMAQKSRQITLRNFGRVIQLYTPLYLSNYCENECVYCGFSAKNDIERKRLTPDEVRAEAESIAATGLKHILVLTGESRKMSPLDYVKDCIKVLKRYFSSITIEIYPLTEDEYREAAAEGVDGLTIYQEVYDEDIYYTMHPGGPKRDYSFRLDAPERGARAGMRSVSIGVLLGLDDWRKEVFLMGLHAKYLQDRYPEVEIGVSLPRLRPQLGSFKAPYSVKDKDIVQMILALRLFVPRLGITISTREDPAFRENLIGLGVTRMSAGSTTVVGGRIAEKKGDTQPSQFDILDRRSVDEIKAVLESKEYQAVLKDWLRL